jgi:hypothetical protein
MITSVNAACFWGRVAFAPPFAWIGSMSGRCCLILAAQGLDFYVAVADGLERIDLIADLEAFVTIQTFELAALLVVQVVEEGAVGFCL